jgi:hypothetical protein
MSFITDMFGGDEAPKVDPFKASDIYSTTGSVIGGPGGSITSTLSPELQKFYDMYLEAAKGAAPSADQINFANQVGQFGQGLFGQAANLDTQAMTSDYYNRVLAGLQPQREEENVQLANTLFSQGRTGAGAGVQGGYVNPEQFALLKAREAANANIYLTAEDRARQIQNEKLQQGLGFYGMGQELRNAPWQTSANLLNTGINLAGVNTPYLGYSLQSGQNVTGVNQTNSQIEAQNRASNLGFWGNLIGGGAMAYAKYSDRRLKTSIKRIGSFKNGLSKYSWTYIWGENAIGAMADEVQKVIPEAVKEVNGFLTVNYDLLGE